MDTDPTGPLSSCGRAVPPARAPRQAERGRTVPAAHNPLKVPLIDILAKRGGTKKRTRWPATPSSHNAPCPSLTAALASKSGRQFRGSTMRIRFWGTRGSLAKPGPTTLRYGGNTSCVEVRTRDGTLIVLDCGTGAHGLGLALAASGERPLAGHLMLTHTHWDHIQGFPFFAPLFVAGNEWDIYAPGGLGQQLETTLAGQMEYTYFPVTLAQLGAATRYHDLVEGSFTIGHVRVVTQYLNHPALALGYRVAVGGVELVYSVDHEPHAPAPCGSAISAGLAAEARPVHAEDRRNIAFLERE